MAITIGQPALAQVNLIISQGADNYYTFKYYTLVGAVKTPVDLSLATARMQIRNKVGGEIWLTLEEVGSSIVLTNNGVIRVHIKAAQTTGTNWESRKKGVYDLEIVDADGLTVRFAMGSVDISPDVTRV
jgi:hypothetical protein